MRKNTSVQKKNDQQPLTRRILQYISARAEEKAVEFVEVSMDLFLFPFISIGHAASRRAEDAYWEQRRAQRAIRDLERAQCIRIQRIGTRLRIALTDEGKMRVLKREIMHAPSCTNEECVIVIFDIPETERTVRILFRRFLKECDFVRLQLSVWATHRAALLHVQTFIQQHGIEEWVQTFIAKRALPAHKERRR